MRHYYVEQIAKGFRRIRELIGKEIRRFPWRNAKVSLFEMAINS